MTQAACNPWCLPREAKPPQGLLPLGEPRRLFLPSQFGPAQGPGGGGVCLGVLAVLAGGQARAGKKSCRSHGPLNSPHRWPTAPPRGPASVLHVNWAWGLPVQVRLVDGTQKPLDNQTLQVFVGEARQSTNYTTDAQGRVHFSIDTANFTTEVINIQVRLRGRREGRSAGKRKRRHLWPQVLGRGRHGPEILCSEQMSPVWGVSPAA